MEEMLGNVGKVIGAGARPVTTTYFNNVLQKKKKIIFKNN